MSKLHDQTIDLEFKNNHLLATLFGERDQHLNRIEKKCDVIIRARGNRLNITGPRHNVIMTEMVLNRLYEHLMAGHTLSISEIDNTLRSVQMADSIIENRESAEVHDGDRQDYAISTRKKVILPRTPGQINYLKKLNEYDLVFAAGPAGTGKTYLATAVAVSHLIKGTIDRIILSRPAIEAGEKLGFLPGTLKEKVDPYLRPLYDALNDMLPAEQVIKRMESGEIEVAPLAFMRGRTLSRAYIILDEAQNTTVEQMKMFVTRLGEGSKMVITGDLTQIDLPRGIKSGLGNALDVLSGIKDIGIAKFNEGDVLRHPLVAKIVKAYNQLD